MSTQTASPKTDDQQRRRRGSSRRRLAAQHTFTVLPTLCTLGNGLCGFLAIFFASREPAPSGMLWDWTPLTVGAVFVFVGMILDVLDGRLARLTRHISDLGEQLDSMSDMVTFGVAPAFLAVQLVAVEAPFLSVKGDNLLDRTVLVIACIYVACTALRLARFNIQIEAGQNSDHMSFEGLPSPGAAGTVASLVLLHQHLLANPDHRDWTMTVTSIGMTLIMCLAALAMASRLQYVHLVNRYLREHAPFWYIALLVAVILLATTFLQEAIAVGFVAYALSAPIKWLADKLWLSRRRAKG